jgi:hypothetical protein
VRGIRLSDRVLVAGQTGKGKTTLAHFLVAGLQPVRAIVFDPKDDLDFGVPKCRSPEELEVQIRDGLVHYVPASFDRETLEEACQIVWLAPGPWLWWIDEAAELTGPNYCPAGLRLAVTQGRQPRKMVLAITQRLAEIHPVFRSQSEHVIIFTPAPILLDLKTIAGNVRREAGELDRLLGELHAEHGDYSHLWYVRDTDELRRCAPLPHPGQRVLAPAGRRRPLPHLRGAWESRLHARNRIQARDVHQDHRDRDRRDLAGEVPLHEVQSPRALRRHRRRLRSASCRPPPTRRRRRRRHPASSRTPRCSLSSPSVRRCRRPCKRSPGSVNRSG